MLLLTDLLRGELGFAFAKFFESGGDILLFPKINEAFYSEMESLISKGVLKIETLRDRVSRILHE